ncbi:hypothetical protein F9K07_30550 (plasmid) [Hydrogenophaga sp. BPS33]|nr:hypothetical protein F9K07_30550 [Hydrogenophaga sp. BPS33]
MDKRCAAPASVAVVGLGPLTNIAAALNMAPDIKPAISEIVVLGGSWGVGGNITPAATFNLYADPEAASVVFRGGVPVTAVSHDAARRVLVTPERIAPFRQMGNNAGKVVADILDSAMDYAMRRRGVKVGPMYDPCVIAYLLQPELFKGARVPVDIETRGEFTAGTTVVDFRGYTKRKANTLWINAVDIDGFYRLLGQQIARLPYDVSRGRCVVSLLPLLGEGRDGGIRTPSSPTHLRSGCSRPCQLTGVSKGWPAMCRVALSMKRTTDA